MPNKLTFQFLALFLFLWTPISNASLITDTFKATFTGDIGPFSTGNSLILNFTYDSVHVDPVTLELVLNAPTLEIAPPTGTPPLISLDPIPQIAPLDPNLEVDYPWVIQLEASIIQPNINQNVFEIVDWSLSLWIQPAAGGQSVEEQFFPPDPVQVSFERTAVPAPGVLALMGLGLAGIGYSRRGKA